MTDYRTEPRLLTPGTSAMTADEPGASMSAMCTQETILGHMEDYLAACLPGLAVWWRVPPCPAPLMDLRVAVCAPWLSWT